MSALVLRSNSSALVPNAQTVFAAQGGVGPGYVYSVLPGGAGGTIGASSGVYIAPAQVGSGTDTIQVVDEAMSATTLAIMIGTPIEMVCDIIQKEMSLDDGRVYIWDQKINQPKNSGIYIAVGVLNCKPFGNTIRTDGSGSGLSAIQSLNMLATLTIDIISRSTEAIQRKEEILMALASVYSQQQQSANSFFIAGISTNFNNLSNIDGSAIPYRFSISVNVQYFVTKQKAVDYFDDFADVEVETES